MTVTLGTRTAETVAIYYERSRADVIRKSLPQKAQTLAEALEDFQRTQLPGASSYGRTIYVDSQYVGDVWCYGISPGGDPEAMVSYCVFEQTFWGRGVASAALKLFLEDILKCFGLERIGAFTYTGNAASIRVLERNGFRLEEIFTEDGVESAYYLKEKFKSSKANLREEEI